MLDGTMLLSESDGYVFRCFTNNPTFDTSSWVLADGRRLLVLEQLKGEVWFNVSHKDLEVVGTGRRNGLEMGG